MTIRTDTTVTTSGAGYTAVVHYPAPAGDPAARDAAAEDVLQSAGEHRGHLGTVVLRGGAADAPELYLVLSFHDHGSYQHWESSEPARAAITRLDQVTGSAPDGNFVDSMAGWFNLPGFSGLRTPPRWKSSVVTLITIIPISLVLMYLLAPFTQGLHPVISAVISSVILVPLLTYVAMPFMTRRLRGWLYPQTNVGLTESTPSMRRGRGAPHPS